MHTLSTCAEVLDRELGTTPLVPTDMDNPKRSHVLFHLAAVSRRSYTLYVHIEISTSFSKTISFFFKSVSIFLRACGRSPGKLSIYAWREKKEETSISFLFISESAHVINRIVRMHYPSLLFPKRITTLFATRTALQWRELQTVIIHFWRVATTISPTPNWIST